MSIQTRPFGHMPDGEPVAEYILTNQNGLTATFLDLGGIWRQMLVPDREGRTADVVLGYDTVEAYLADTYNFGALVGRNANRIGGASLELNGVTYHLAVNSGLRDNLHSGPDLYGRRKWRAEQVALEGAEGLQFNLSSPDGDQGYPGNTEIRVTYALREDNALVIRYQVESDADTICNLTNHAYFNLDGHGAQSAMEQEVWIDAKQYSPTDQYSIPTGELAPVQGTPMDFTRFKPIAQDIAVPFDQLTMAGGYDHNWVLDHPTGVLSLSAAAYSPVSGRKMEVWTTLPGIQFYTGNYMDPDIPGKGGVRYGCRGGYCFETQYYPDAIHHPEQPSPILRAGECAETCTVYRFLIQ